jgi:hypothetical protein
MSAEATIAEGRPGAGQLLAAEMDAAALGRAKRRDLRPLAELLPFLRLHVADAVASGLFLLVSTTATLGLTLVLRIVVNQGIGGHTAASLDRSFLLLGAVAVVLALGTAGRFFFITRLGERVVADLREALYRHVLRLDQAYFLTVRTGEVMSRLTTDLTIVENMVGSSISVAMRNALTFVGAFLWLIWLSPTFTALVVLLGVVVIVPLFVVGRWVRRLSVRAQEKFAAAVAYAGETLDGLDTVQAFGREAHAAARFAAAVEAAFQASVKRITARALMTGPRLHLLARAARQLRGPRSAHVRGRPAAVRVPRRAGRRSGGGAGRVLGRRAEDLRGHGAHLGNPEGEAGHRPARLAAIPAAAAARRGCVRGGELRLPGSTRPARLDRLQPGGAGRRAGGAGRSVGRRQEHRLPAAVAVL